MAQQEKQSPELKFEFASFLFESEGVDRKYRMCRDLVPFTVKGRLFRNNVQILAISRPMNPW